MRLNKQLGGIVVKFEECHGRIEVFIRDEFDDKMYASELPVCSEVGTWCMLQKVDIPWRFG